MGGWVRAGLWGVFWVARWVTWVLPRPWLHWLGRGSAPLIYAFVPGVRRGLWHNAGFLLGEGATPRARRDLGVAQLRHFARFAVEVLTVGKGDPTPAEEVFATMQGAEHFEAAKAGGKGVVGLTLHLGNHEFAARLLAGLSERVALVYTPDPIGVFERVRSEGRRAGEIEEVALGRSPLFGVRVLEVLRAGGFVVACADRGFAHERGQWWSCLGGELAFLEWPRKISAASGAPVLPSFLVAREGGYRLIMEAPIWPEEEGGWERLVEVFARRLREDAAQWLVLHPAFRVGRPGSPVEDLGLG